MNSPLSLLCQSWQSFRHFLRRALRRAIPRWLRPASESAHRFQACILTGELLAIVGCSSPPHPIHVYEAINTSTSARPQLTAFANQTTAIQVTLQPNSDIRTLYRVDSDTLELAAEPVSANVDELDKKLAGTLAPTATADNTLTERFWTKLAQRVQSDHMPVVIVFHTDGWSEGTTAEGHHQIEAAARQIAENPKVKAVIIIGAKPETREELRRDLAPLDQKLGPEHFLLLDGSRDDMDQVTAQIEAVRH